MLTELLIRQPDPIGASGNAGACMIFPTLACSELPFLMLGWWCDTRALVHQSKLSGCFGVAHVRCTATSHCVRPADQTVSPASLSAVAHTLE